MAFVMFVCCLFKIGFLTEADKAAVGLTLFDAYFDLGIFEERSSFYDSVLSFRPTVRPSVGEQCKQLKN